MKGQDASAKMQANTPTVRQVTRLCVGGSGTTSAEGKSAANGGRVVAASDKRVHEAGLKLLTAKSGA